MSKKPLTYQEIHQLIHSAPNERIRKLWEGVLAKLEKDPPPIAAKIKSKKDRLK